MTRGEIEDRAIALLRSYQRSSDPLEKTRLLKEVAGLLVDLREHFLTDTGEPDWKGATHAYKAAVGETYRRAGFREIGTISSSVRYHIGNVLRDRLTTEQLDDVGLKHDTPRTRSVGKRDRNRALLAALRPGSPGSEAPVDPVRGILGAGSLLTRVDSEALAQLSPGQREHAAKLLQVASDECKRLGKALRDAGK